jgi:GNAT superfamily N-acetyltransferase
MQFAWRRMETGDLAAVDAISRIVHPQFPEEPTIYAERMALYPAGCFVLADSTACAGYLLSHPWAAGRVPKLNTALGAIPPGADAYYLHDLALLPELRGQDWGARIVQELAETVRFPRMALVSVHRSASFWKRQGFVTTQLAVEGYGDDARYMVREL